MTISDTMSAHRLPTTDLLTSWRRCRCSAGGRAAFELVQGPQHPLPLLRCVNCGHTHHVRGGDVGLARRLADAALDDHADAGWARDTLAARLVAATDKEAAWGNTDLADRCSGAAAVLYQAMARAGQL